MLGLARSDLDLDALAELPDDEVKARLVAIRGLGEWTADWFLARHLARPHAWPRVTWDCGRPWPRSMVTCPTFVRFAARFHPFENLTAHYLLTGLRLAPPA